MDVVSINDAITRGQGVLNKLSMPQELTDLNVTNDGSVTVLVGRNVHVVDSVNVVDDYFPIYKHSINYPTSYDVVSVGDKAFDLASYLEYRAQSVKRLEDEQLRDTDVVTNLVQSSVTLSAYPSKITVTSTKLNDTFVLSHPDDNGKLGRGAILDEMEAASPNWSPTNAAVARSNTQYKVGSYSMSVTPSATTVTLEDTTNHGDLSAYLADATGVTAIWIYLTATTDVTAIVLRIGSTSGNYVEITGQCFAQSDLVFPATGWNYVVFRHSLGAKTGTPNWASVAYKRLVLTMNAGLPVVYLDYMTCGTGDLIGLNGLGDRRTTWLVSTYNYP